MSSQAKIALSSLVLLIGLSFYTYARFNSFRPKNLQPLEEVHGSATEAAAEIAFPQNYTLLGTTQTEHTKQITFETTVSAQEVQSFYKNIFSAGGWQVEYEGRVEDSYRTGYKREKEKVKVLSSQDGEKTVVSVEFTTP